MSSECIDWFEVWNISPETRKNKDHNKMSNENMQCWHDSLNLINFWPEDKYTKCTNFGQCTKNDLKANGQSVFWWGLIWNNVSEQSNDEWTEQSSDEWTEPTNM